MSNKVYHINSDHSLFLLMSVTWHLCFSYKKYAVHVHRERESSPFSLAHSSIRRPRGHHPLQFSFINSANCDDHFPWRESSAFQRRDGLWTDSEEREPQISIHDDLLLLHPEGNLPIKVSETMMMSVGCNNECGCSHTYQVTFYL